MSFSNRIDIFTPTLPISGLPITGKVQLTTDYASAPLAVKIYAKSDTSFASPIVTTSGTADANGDFEFSMDLGSNITQPGTYVIQASRTSGSPSLTTLTSDDLSLGAIGTMIMSLRTVLCAFDDIERHEEPALPNAAMDTFRFGYGNWTSDSPIFGEQDESDTTPGANYKVDYTYGRFLYLTALQSGHDVRSTYKFSIFSDADYTKFFARALATVNGWKPQTGFTLDSAPSQWLDVLVLGAYVHALEALSLKIPGFKYGRVFEDRAAMMAQINLRLAEARAEFKELIAKIKRRGYIMPIGISSLNGGGLAYQADNTNWRTFIIGG